MLRRLVYILLLLAGWITSPPLLHAQESSYENDFTGGSNGLIMASILPEHSDGTVPYAFSFENDELVITNNKTEWYFIQNFWPPADRLNVCDFPFVRFKMKTDTAVGLRIQLRGGGTDTPWLDGDLIGDGEYHEYLFDFTDVIGDIDCNELAEVKFDIPGFIQPGNFMPGTLFYLDDYAIGQAAAPVGPVVVNDSYLNDFSTGNTEFVAIPGSLANLSVNDTEELEIDLDKQAWWFFQDFFGNETDFNLCQYPYLSFRLKTEAVAQTNWRVNIKSVGPNDGISVGNVNQTITGDGQYTTYTYDFTELFANAPPDFDCSKIREIQIDPGGFQQGGNSIQGLFTMDDYAIGKAAFPESHFYPTLNPIQDVALIPAEALETVTVPLFGITDGDDGTQELTITATSSNQAMLQDGNISIGDVSNLSADLNLDLEDGIFGTTTITVTVTDNGNPPLSVTQAFELLVFDNKSYVTHYDDQDETPMWSAPKFYSYTQDNSLLQIDMNKGQAEVVFGRFTLPTEINITESPYLMVEAQTDRALNFDVRLIDVDGNGSDVMRRTIEDVEPYVWYEYTFEGNEEFNLGRVAAIEFIPNGWQFSGTRRATVYEGTLLIDQLMIGSAATPTGIHFNAIDDQSCYIGSEAQTIVLSDLSDNITELEISSADEALLPVDSIEVAFNGATGTIQYTPVADQKGEVELTFSATDGTNTRSQVFILEVKGNEPPTADQPADQEIVAGETSTLALSGIDDGNAEAAQVVSATLTSSNEAILPNPTALSESGDASFDQRERNGVVSLAPPEGFSGPVTVTLTLTDGEGDEEQSSIQTFTVEVFESLNAPPTISGVENQQVFVNEEAQLTLTGLSDGGNDSENLSLTIETSDTSILNADAFTISPITDGQAILTYTPDSTGSVELTVNISDDGGIDGVNNGDQSTTTGFRIDIIPEPITGEIAVYEESRWNIDTDDGSSDEIVDDGQGGEAWRATFTENKRNWNGQGYQFVNELNLTDYPYVTFEARVVRDGGSSNSDYNVYLWDNEGRYTTGSSPSTTIQAIPADGAWHRITIDFTNQLFHTAQQVPLNAARMTRLHLHIEGGKAGSLFPWLAGDYYIRDLRIGSEVTELTGNNTVVASINGISQQWITTSDEEREVTISGIESGNDNPPELTITDNSNPELGEISFSDVVDGQATMTFVPTGETGSSNITVEVSGMGVDIPASSTFNIRVIDPKLINQATLTLDASTELQEIQGFGAFYDRSGNLAEEAVNDMGLSIIRVEIEPEFEPVNDNDNASIVNYDALDFDYIHPGIAKYKAAFEAAAVQDWKVIATAWSPPYWMKYSLAEIGGPLNSAPGWGGTDNKVRPELYEEYAEFLAAWWLAVKAKTGVEVYAICPQNEPAYSQFYNSAILSPERFAEVVAVTGPKFEELGVTAKIFMPEQNFDQGVNGYSMLAYMEALKAHPTASQYTDIIATHGYASDGIGVGNLGGEEWIEMKNQSRDYTAAEGGPKELWMTETSGEPDNHQEGAMRVAGAIGLGLSKGEAQGWVYWTLQSGASDDGARFGYYRGRRKTVKYYAAKHFYRYFQPGTQMMAISSDEDNLIVNAGIRPDGTTAIVVVNAGDRALGVQWDINGALPEGLEYFQSISRSYFMEGDRSADNRMILPPYSITTLVTDEILESPSFTADNIPDQEVMSDGSSYQVDVANIQFNGEMDDISLDVVSGDASIIPAPEVSEVSGGTGTITFTPVEDTEGTVPMTVTISSGLTSITKTFDVEVLLPTDVSSFKDAGIEVFPVPADQSLYIRSGNPLQHVRIMSANGATMFEEDVESASFDVNLEQFPKGTYILQLIQNEQTVVGKIFVQ
ncbi:MAG: T9SS type A sorting domain-containing protein [Phaeodactylibacter sp.]|uniref:T9SS type A sorting domain-containing protein n=1 Tax=Phaeodactylibacter sp. TaxID=1940289 RepID=UPI0032EE6279